MERMKYVMDVPTPIVMLFIYGTAFCEYLQRNVLHFRALPEDLQEDNSEE